MMEVFSTPEAWFALATLAAMEIVLGIDNIIFISIVTGKLPLEKQARARRLGIGLAAIMRILLLFSISWVMGLTAAVFTVLGNEISWRDIILIGGGLFLIFKAAMEMHDKLEGVDHTREVSEGITFRAAIIQILMLDLVFSLDSVITAVGMVDEITIMVVAVLIAVTVMVLFAGPVGSFVSRHPTVQMLALGFLFLIGMVLIADGFDHHVPKGYVYSAIGFATIIELLNLRMRRKSEPVRLHHASMEDATGSAAAGKPPASL